MGSHGEAMVPLDHWRVIVLGAGRGTRMGTPKALMRFRDQAWWCFQRERLRPICQRPIFVVSDAVARSMDEESGGALDVDIVRAAPDAPMFASVVAGLRRALQGADAMPGSGNDGNGVGISAGICSCAGVALLPIDTPVALASTWVRVIERAASEGRPTCPSPAPGLHGHPLAIPLVWLRAHAPALLNVSVGGAGAEIDPAARLDEIIRPARLIVPVDDPRCAMNLNTPADLVTFEVFERANPRPSATQS